jgi:hypothetical protein
MSRHALLIVFVSSLGCAMPAPIVRLDPAVSNVTWVAGRAVVEKESNGVRVAAAFERQEGCALGLRVEIQNGTSGRLEVGPSDVTFTACGGDALSTCSPTHLVTDPEQVLAKLAAAQSTRQADAANSQAFLGTLVMLNAVGDVASAASGHAGPRAGQGTAAAADLMGADAEQSDRALSSMASQEQLWSDVALRRNTLYPGRGVAGRVYIPIDPAARYVWLHVRTGNEVFSFRFQQTVMHFRAGRPEPGPT